MSHTIAAGTLISIGINTMKQAVPLQAGNTAMTALEDGMRDARMKEGGHTGFCGIDIPADKEYNDLVTRFSNEGKLSDDDVYELNDAFAAAEWRHDEIFYRYGLQDAFRLLIEALQFGNCAN